MNDDAKQDPNKDRWIDVLIAMHAYNDVSAKHHDESSRRSANVFILIYFFLTGVIVTNGLSALSLLVAVFLAVIARFGYNLVRMHANAAGMHYWRNQKIRDELDTVRTSNRISLKEIHEESRDKFTGPYSSIRYGYSVWYSNWARVHQIFLVAGVIVIILFVINQVSCFGKGGCIWVQGTEAQEKLSGPFRDFLGRLIPQR